MDSRPITNPNKPKPKTGIVGVRANLGGSYSSYSIEDLRRLQEAASNPFSALNWLFSPNTTLKGSSVTGSSVHSPLETFTSKITDSSFWLDTGLILLGFILVIIAIYVIMQSELNSFTPKFGKKK